MFTYDMIPVPLPPLAIDKIYRTPEVDRSELVHSTDPERPSIIRLTLSDETTIELPFTSARLRELLDALVSQSADITSGIMRD